MSYEGYIGAEPHTDPRFVVVTRLTDFGALGAPPASDIVTRQPFRQKAIQKFIVTAQEGAVLHQGR